MSVSSHKPSAQGRLRVTPYWNIACQHSSPQNSVSNLKPSDQRRRQFPLFVCHADLAVGLEYRSALAMSLSLGIVLVVVARRVLYMRCSCYISYALLTQFRLS